MALTLNGDGNITGLAAGGLSDLSVATADIADAAITAAKLDGAQSGSAPIYGARAWVNFNGTGTVAIRASGNVSSITDNGTGDYTVNFTTAMPDANFEVNGVAYYPGVAAATFGLASTATGSVRVQAINTDGTATIDVDQMHVAIFR
jgi:hypothetical protein